MARRMRPADTWLPHSAHSVAETAAWDWDLRPLWDGGVAVPWGAAGSTPSTELNVPVLQAIREGDYGGFADRAIIDEMVLGVGDDAELPRGTLLCAPHQSALSMWAQARTKLQTTAGAAGGDLLLARLSESVHAEEEGAGDG